MYFIKNEQNYVWDGYDWSDCNSPKLFQTYSDANRVRQKLYRKYDTKIYILEY